MESEKFVICCNRVVQEEFMNDDTQQTPAGVDATDDRTITEKTSETVVKAVQDMGAAYDGARKPGMPLSILSNIAREAPLGSLLVAFLLGVAVARRR
jgi:hypothetical protein